MFELPWCESAVGMPIRCSIWLFPFLPLWNGEEGFSAARLKAERPESHRRRCPYPGQHPPDPARPSR